MVDTTPREKRLVVVSACLLGPIFLLTVCLGATAVHIECVCVFL